MKWPLYIPFNLHKDNRADELTKAWFLFLFYCFPSVTLAASFTEFWIAETWEKNRANRACRVQRSLLAPAKRGQL
jgi:hypothetical protein